MVYSVTDIAGLNQVLRGVLSNAGAAISGMARSFASRQSDRGENTTEPVKRVGITMFGVTTPGVDAIRIRPPFPIVPFHDSQLLFLC